MSTPGNNQTQLANEEAAIAKFQAEEQQRLEANKKARLLATVEQEVTRRANLRLRAKRLLQRLQTSADAKKTLRAEFVNLYDIEGDGIGAARNPPRYRATPFFKGGIQ